MTDFSKMDGQALCDWLESHGALELTNALRLYDSDYWNLSACAFAARDWIFNSSISLGVSKWMDIISIAGHPLKSTSLDWLRAAAIVVAEKEGKP